jgi:hypothetical protein
VQPLRPHIFRTMADESGLTSLTAAYLSDPLPEPFPKWFRIGPHRYAYVYRWQFGKVWRCDRQAHLHPTTGPTDKLFLIKMETEPGSAGFSWMAVHAPGDVTDAATLLLDNKVVFGQHRECLGAWLSQLVLVQPGPVGGVEPVRDHVAVVIGH